MFDPDLVLLLVDNVDASQRFYTRLTGRAPVELSPTFALFVLPSGLRIGLWSRHTVEPAPGACGGGSELAFTLPDDAAVSAYFDRLAADGVTVLQPPCHLDFGFTFVVLDPDGHRLRVLALADA